MEIRDTTQFTCANCDIAITGPPVTHVGLPFCCAGCVAGGPCGCSYDEPSWPSGAVDRRQPVQVHECLDLTTVTHEREPARQPVLAGR